MASGYAHVATESEERSSGGDSYFPPNKSNVTSKTQRTFSFGRPSGPVHRTSSGFSLPPQIGSPWEHKLNEKHIRETPTNTETVRYFDPKRQTRRVFLDCFFMWFWTFGICLALFGTLYGFSSITTGITQVQKYAYNALVTGLSIVLGLAFAAQFKQYAEMMRWRFLASQYRSLEDFEDVLGCDSYRSTMRILWNGRRRGVYYPTKTQLIAAFWLAVFVAFNTFAALLGLTYSIDVADDKVSITYGNISYTSLDVIYSNLNADLDTAALGAAYSPQYQRAAANLWGDVGQNVPAWSDTSYPGDPAVQNRPGANIYGLEDNSLFWYRFTDMSPDLKYKKSSTRTLSNKVTCTQMKLTYGGYAGFQTTNTSIMWDVYWIDEHGNPQFANINNQVTFQTTYAGNISSACGPRCVQIVALQAAYLNGKNATFPNNYEPPKIWACNSTVSQVDGLDTSGFDDVSPLKLADEQAQYLAGAIGWSGVDDGSDLQYQNYNGDTIFNPDQSITDAALMAQLIMEYNTGAMASMDNYNGPRSLLTGTNSPRPMQAVNVKWPYAGAILAGIPILQFFMLIGVVLFASKAIILEPSFMTAAHILYPVIQKVGKDGCLFSVEEIAQRLGGDYKISFNVRPDANDPGHYDTTFVRDLDVIEEREGFGYIRGHMPEGRYD